jgi:hypothetical protein
MCLASAQRRRVVRDNTASHCAGEFELSQAARPRIKEWGDAYEIRHDEKSTRTVTNPATVRELLKDDFEGTLAKVAQIGYREVEFAGYFNHSAKDLRAILDRYGLATPSAHVPYGVLEDKWSSALDEAHTLGHAYIVCPGSTTKSARCQTVGSAPPKHSVVPARYPKRAESSLPITTIISSLFQLTGRCPTTSCSKKRTPTL